LANNIRKTKSDSYSSWSDSIVGDECLHARRTQVARHKPVEQKLVLAKNFPLTQQVTAPPRANISKEVHGIFSDLKSPAK